MKRTVSDINDDAAFNHLFDLTACQEERGWSHIRASNINSCHNDSGTAISGAFSWIIHVQVVLLVAWPVNARYFKYDDQLSQYTLFNTNRMFEPFINLMDSQYSSIYRTLVCCWSCIYFTQPLRKQAAYKQATRGPKALSPFWGITQWG